MTYDWRLFMAQPEDGLTVLGKTLADLQERIGKLEKWLNDNRAYYDAAKDEDLKLADRVAKLERDHATMASAHSVLNVRVDAALGKVAWLEQGSVYGGPRPTKPGSEYAPETEALVRVARHASTCVVSSCDSCKVWLREALKPFGGVP